MIDRCYCIGATVEDSECNDGRLRLVNGRNVLEGRLEICINHVWGTVCSVGFSADEARVVCRNLNFTSGEYNVS